MDPKHVVEMLKHLERQHELLVDAQQAMSDELHTLQIEEEMLMRKLYEVMTANTNKECDKPELENSDRGALVCMTSNGEVVESTIRDVPATPSSIGGDVKKPLVYSRRKKL